MISDYKIIRKELEKYRNGLETKKEIIILTKQDTVDEKTLLNAKKLFLEHGKENIFFISMYDETSIKNLFNYLLTQIKQE